MSMAYVGGRSFTEMSRLEDLRPNASVQGILPNCLVSVVNTQ